MKAENDYLKQVVDEQASVERQLQVSRKAQSTSDGVDRSRSTTSSSTHGMNYRITGFWIWKTVVVAPNAYVIHTRRGEASPRHIGLGISFRFNPNSDAFLVIPAAMQTLPINARCICKERQGILVQAYVQWIVEDIKTAYRQLDFSDPENPVRIVNLQLREQAEAAIKDKVATMSIDDVLSDKQPIIEELTTRLRAVAEGGRDSGTGLGLKIATVQINEAVVSSTQLWQNLQKPFRSDRERIARLAELEAQQQIDRQGQVDREKRETAQLEIDQRLAQLKHEQERDQFDREQGERERRLHLEQESERKSVLESTSTEKARKEADLELDLHRIEMRKRKLTEELEAVRREMELDQLRAEQNRLRASQEEETKNVTHGGEAARTERDLVLFRQRREVENDLTHQHVQAQLIEQLPELASSLPRPDELKAISIGGDMNGVSGSLVGFLASTLSLLEDRLRKPPENKTESNSE